MVLHPNGIENGSGGTPKKKDYYNSGSSEPAETSELVLNRLEAVSGDAALDCHKFCAESSIDGD